ncbi:hypothetical protein D9615_006080 [Tricholomella constricta]|uniref:Uncharacterized protein n=1 Tax=Tricholomella constricta TaxID=117010 RepID=A0A8H5H9B7_9AGAR|nr:hypothetical protein D9615_006080 [Tricholomella constricta]
MATNTPTSTITAFAFAFAVAVEFTPTTTITGGSIPFPTYTSPPTPTDTDGETDTHHAPSGFSPGASPPLILAFLAVGLFAISMMGVLGWRRVQLGRAGMTGGGGDQGEAFGEWDEEGGGGVGVGVGMGGRGRGRGRGGSGGGVGPRPRLWDLWTRTGTGRGKREGKRDDWRKEEEEQEVVGWNEILPVSVAVIAPRSHNAINDTADATTAQMRYRNWRRGTAPAAATTPAKEMPGTDEGTGTGPDTDTDTGRLLVVVAIAMPSPPRRSSDGDGDRNGDEDENGDDDGLEYTLGVYECDWRREEDG